MEIRKNKGANYINLIDAKVNGRLDAVLFQKNQIIRIDKNRLVKYKAKKLEKDK